MQVLIRGWRARNLRGGLRHLDIDLGEQPSRWTLIQMANGMGKTTTMTLLRYIFTDDPIPPLEVQSFRGGDEPTGTFELRLLVDGRPYRLGFEFDFRDGSATRYTVRADTRDGGHVPGRVLPVELGDLLTGQMARLFVFDGELARSIRDMSKRTADDAIRALYRLGQISGLKGSVDHLVDLEQRRASAMTSASEERGLTRLRNARNEAAAVKARLETEVAATGGALEGRRAEERRLRGAVQERISEDEGLRERLRDLEERERDLRTDVNGLNAEALTSLRRPPCIDVRVLERLQSLGGRLFELKLPETMSAEFFRDLANRDDCICGRPLGHDEKEHIIQGAHRYLAQDQISIINQMKLALRSTEGDAQGFADTIGRLGAKLTDRQRLKTERERLEVERVGQGDEELLRLQGELDACRSDIERLSAQMERLTSRDAHRQRALRVNWETNLPLCENEFEDREDRLSVATNTRLFKRKAEALKILIDRVDALSLERLRERVRTRTNDKLVRIARTEVLEVTRIHGGLEIWTPGVGTKDDVSEGQSLSVAYAFLTSLLSEAPYRLPFVVDSPAVSLDSVNRREVGELIPGFFDQMIMFVISTEREGFAESFYDRGDHARFLTIVREGGDTRVEAGLEFFRTFQDREAA